MVNAFKVVKTLNICTIYVKSIFKKWLLFFHLSTHLGPKKFLVLPGDNVPTHVCSRSNGGSSVSMNPYIINIQVASCFHVSMIMKCSPFPEELLRYLKFDKPKPHVFS